MDKTLNVDEVLKLAIQTERQSLGGVDIVKIANQLGIEVNSSNECDSFFNASIEYFPEEKKFKILVNDSHSRNRVRFSIAHEIAHFILHKDQIINEKTMTRSNQENEAIEKEADELAGRLLIPDELLEEFVNKNNIQKEKEITKDQLGWISNHFRVSIVVAVIRLRKLGYTVPYISFSYMA